MDRTATNCRPVHFLCLLLIIDSYDFYFSKKVLLAAKRGLSVISHYDSHAQALSATHMTQEAVIFAISQSGSSKSIVDNSRLGRENGATLITLTNLGRTPLAKLADIPLYTTCAESRYRVVAQPSCIAQVALIDILCTYVAVRRDWTYDFTRKDNL